MTARVPRELSCDINILPSRSLISTQDSLSKSSRIRPSLRDGCCGGAAAASVAALGTGAGAIVSEGCATGCAGGCAAGFAAARAVDCGGGGVSDAILTQGKAAAGHS